MTHALSSMTGFGTASASAAGQRYRVEVKTVNHRNLQVRLHLPPELAAVEGAARKLLKGALNRGAVDVFVNTAREGDEDQSALDVHVDLAGARTLMAALEELAGAVGAPKPDLALLLRAGDILDVRAAPVDAEALGEAFLGALERAVEGVIAMRTREGQALAADLASRLGTLEILLDRVDEVAPEVRAGFEARLRQRLEEATERHGLELDEGRVITELIVFAEKADVTEEVVRARTHVAAFHEHLAGGAAEGTGKRLDFLCQELGRELNTIGSKCRDAELAGLVVEGKVELERIREQVQNLV